jgi:hypothetical protein
VAKTRAKVANERVERLESTLTAMKNGKTIEPANDNDEAEDED